MIDDATPLLLGSASPRRKDILAGLGIPFFVQPADVDEDVLPGENPSAYLDRIVDAKLQAVAARAEGQTFAGILVADTTVVLGERILGKPSDVSDAERLLAALAGNTHVVYTRYAISRADTPGRPVVRRTVATNVTLRPASADELRRYAETGEGLDKAGAYAAQGLGAFLVERIDGSYANVVGLPACELVADLLGIGLLEHFP